MKVGWTVNLNTLTAEQDRKSTEAYGVAVAGAKPEPINSDLFKGRPQSAVLLGG